ncbi:response regulator [Cecembia lonarensis]|uniref:Cyclic di-GMP phosphodiesterase response regulator RpfG n=1 Tax=Cecembia lonarensis (strain CCUG 58316 / KCTC 22772 / LW9) TaxID=1225176 RepID=K1LB82_CECL9|nr:response regulator [Cecembia lonarensis]EKB49527.1 Cyclic di-GMP phosphodiesterase response regulator RpfG [Cecembia lonarensis LW9]
MSKIINRIIFVDDDTIQHMINRKNLQRLKPEIELFFFENPFNALEWMEGNDADLLILDVNMPEMSGWDFLDLLQKRGKTIEVKMLTSSMDPSDIELSMNYSMVSGFLIKPLKNEIMAEILGVLP